MIIKPSVSSLFSILTLNDNFAEETCVNLNYIDWEHRELWITISPKKTWQSVQLYNTYCNFLRDTRSTCNNRHKRRLSFRKNSKNSKKFLVLFQTSFHDWGQYDRRKILRMSFLSMFQRSCFGSSMVYIYISLFTCERISIARGLRNLWKLFCSVLILILVPPVQHAVDRVVSGNHDVSLTSCLPGSAWHRHDHCLTARPPVFCNARDVFAINLRRVCRHPWKLNLPASSSELISS